MREPARRLSRQRIGDHALNKARTPVGLSVGLLAPTVGLSFLFVPFYALRAFGENGQNVSYFSGLGGAAREIRTRDP